jgi:hypothetical protein
MSNGVVKDGHGCADFVAEPATGSAPRFAPSRRSAEVWQWLLPPLAGPRIGMPKGVRRASEGKAPTSNWERALRASCVFDLKFESDGLAKSLDVVGMSKPGREVRRFNGQHNARVNGSKIS